MTGDSAESSAVVSHNLNQLGGALEADVATMKGEAEELASHRPHKKPHFYDIEEQLRYSADRAEEAMETWYYE